MTAKLTYPPMGRRREGPPPVQCAACREDVWGAHYVDFQPYCGDCLPRDAWLALAREHSAAVRGGAA